MKANPVISIIIPVYNLEKYISKCLDSCLAQDLEKADYEIICVNDGSKDGSLDILTQYSQRYPNIRVINKENGGVSSARNMGLDEARGKYLWLVDGDDAIRTNCLKFIVDTMDKNNADLLMHDIKITYNEDERTDIPLGDIPYKIAEGVVDTYNISRRPYGGGAWTYILKRDICVSNNLYFRPDMQYSEDLCFMFLYKSYCEKCIVVNEPLYYYYMRISSATHNMDVKHHIYCLEESIKIYESVGIKYPKENYFILKINDAVKSLIMDLISLGDIEYAKSKFKELKQRGLYPVKLDLLPVFKLKNKKSKIMAFVWVLCSYKPVCLTLIRMKKFLRK